MAVFTNPIFEALDTDGTPLASGKVYFFAAGTSTPKDVYPTQADAAASTNALSNPVILDSTGKANIWPGSGSYKTRVDSSADVTIYPAVDNLAGSDVSFGAGEDLTGSSTSDILWNTNKFIVLGATGNTTVGGTFTSNGVGSFDDDVRLANTKELTWRDAGNTTDMQILDVDSNDDIQLGDSSSATVKDLVLSSGSGSTVSVKSGGSVAMTFDSSQRVGIGTASPGEPLDVKTQTTNVGGIIQGSYDSNANPKFTLQKSNGTIASPTAITTGHLAGQFQFSGYDGDSWNVGADIYAQTTGTIADGRVPMEMIFRTAPDLVSGVVEAMRITEDGYVGINSNAPTERLAVEGSGSANEIVARFNNEGDYASRVQFRNSTRTCYLSIGGSTPDTLATDMLAYSIGLGHAAALSPIQFWNGSSGSVKMTILTGGEVGINTVAPGQKLSVEGDAAANENIARFNNEGNYASRVLFRNSTKTGYLSIAGSSADTLATGMVAHAIGLGTSAAVSPIQFWNGGTGSVKVTIDTDGKTTFFASTTTAATINIPHGTAPSSPVNGDMWTTTAGLYVRINGGTVGPLA